MTRPAPTGFAPEYRRGLATGHGNVGNEGESTGSRSRRLVAKASRVAASFAANGHRFDGAQRERGKSSRSAVLRGAQSKGAGQ
jgi:hypothetical protein